MVEKVMQRRQHVQQSYRSVLGILRLSDDYGGDRLEAAYRRALLIGTCRYDSIESILKKGLDQQELEPILMDPRGGSSLESCQFSDANMIYRDIS
jgi:hypothetical protein